MAISSGEWRNSVITRGSWKRIRPQPYFITGKYSGFLVARHPCEVCRVEQLPLEEPAQEQQAFRTVETIAPSGPNDDMVFGMCIS